MAPQPATPTVLPLLTPDEFAQRLVGMFPPTWTNAQARKPGGTLYAVMETLGSQLSFELGAPITQLVTLGGAATPNDTVTLSIAGTTFQGARTLTHTVQIGETLSDVANALAYLVSADPVLRVLAVRASAIGPVITIAYPAIAPTLPWTNAAPTATALTILGSVSVGATETIAIAPGGSSVTGSLQYAWASTRIQIAEGNALDLAADDFFGTVIERVPGEPDGAFRTRILMALANLGQGATRQSVSNAIQAVTGAVPRIVEPWSPGDTGVIDGEPGAGMMFYDVDTAVTPGRITDPSLAYQGFVDTVLPEFPVLGGNPLPCMDVGIAPDGLYFDVAGSSMFDFLGSVATGAQAVYDAINRTKVFGTVVWVRFSGGLANTFIVGASIVGGPDVLG